MKIYSYVVEHDTGYAPDPEDDLCTLCRCKFRKHPGKRRNIVELAKVGDWVIGTGGASKKSAGHGKLVYAMRVDEILQRGEYYNRYPKRRDNKNDPPRSNFEKQEQFALLSRHFYYFGANAVDLPEQFSLEKQGPGFRKRVDCIDIDRFLEWLKGQSKPGKHGEPCCPEEPVGNPKGRKRCKSSC